MRVRHILSKKRGAAFVRGRLAALLIPALIVGGCVSDEPPPFESPASAAYRADLESCRSAVATAHTANGAEGFFAGDCAIDKLMASTSVKPASAATT